MVCLDTDIAIDFLRNDKEVIKKLEEYRDKEIELSTTSINTFELLKGALRSKQEDAMETLRGFLNNLKILNFNFETSEKAAKIFESLRIKGELIDPLDLIIASVVIENKETLWTRNIKHFKRIPELKIEA